jgi:hypothetical protein
MALKLGAENKRNVIIVAVLLCVLVYLAISQLSGPSTPSAPAKPATASASRVAGPGAARTGNGGNGNGAEAKKVANSGLDPSLHLEKLALSESIEYAGHGRNIFSAESAPVQVETAVASARPAPPTAPVEQAYIAPQPPAIDLKFFGYSAGRDGKKEAFLLHGDDIFEAAAGEIVNHRYKVVSVDARSIQVTDLSYNNTQTLQLLAN